MKNIYFILHFLLDPVNHKTTTKHVKIILARDFDNPEEDFEHNYMFHIPPVVYKKVFLDYFYP